tara:strand:- start:64 stop:969 length:906 start_codon:yes stop_codon:yes gene_type:complete
MAIERTFNNILWRKKVDNYIFSNGGTVIPKHFVKVWNLNKYFIANNGKLSKNAIESNVEIKFRSSIFSGNITITSPKNRGEVHRLYFENKLVESLKKTYLMSHIRWLEWEIRKQSSGKTADKTMHEIENETPFWEFLDIEFNEKEKKFILTAHYKQIASFPKLFESLVESPRLKHIEDSLFKKSGYRIHKTNWKERALINTELGAKNVVYTLLDDKNKLIYIGETSQELRVRLADKNFYNEVIPNWTHYRYDSLPRSIDGKGRVAIERMLIRSYATILSNDNFIPSFDISNYKLVNRNIDS